jgi:hypothetical protein
MLAKTNAAKPDSPLLVHHVARMCGISRRTVRWAAQHGVLPGFRDPRTPKIWRFRREDVISFKACRQQRLFDQTCTRSGQ